MNEHPSHIIAERVDRLARLLRARSQISGLNPAQWMALRYIGQANRFSRYPTAVTRYLAATKGTVSQTLISLERKGLIKRQRSSTDQRMTQLSLTEAGEILCRRDPLQDIEAASTMLGDDAAHLAALLGRMLDALGEIAETSAFGRCGTCHHADNSSCSVFGILIDAELAGQLCAGYEAAL